MIPQPTVTKLRPSEIRIFLADGSPSGLRVVEKSNWIGRGIVFPRSGYADVKSRPELDKAGVYVLSGLSEVTARDQIYIGEGDPVRPRLDSHAAKKDFWTQGCVFISKDDNLNKAHVQYLEARLHELAVRAKRVGLDNGNTPTRPSLSEAGVADMEAFLAEMLVCFPVLGLSAFELAAERPRAARMFFTTARGTDAKGFETDDGFVVLAGSTMSGSEVDSIPAPFSSIRAQLLESGVAVAQGDHWVLKQDYLFRSPSTAASVVLGRNSNGRTEWKDETGRTLKQMQESAG